MGIFEDLLRTKTAAELEALIDNWMLAAGSISDKPILEAVTHMIREAEAILEEKRNGN